MTVNDLPERRGERVPPMMERYLMVCLRTFHETLLYISVNAVEAAWKVAQGEPFVNAALAVSSSGRTNTKGYIESAAGISSERMDEILRTHRIAPELMRTDDFNSFLVTRRNAIIELIEQAIGKPVARDLGQPSDEIEYDTDADYQSLDDDGDDGIDEETAEELGKENGESSGFE